MKISIIFLFIISFFSVFCETDRDIYCRGAREGCYRGCTNKLPSVMASCRKKCDKDYVNCKRGAVA